MSKKIIALLFLSVAAFSLPTFAGWHVGEVSMVAIGYDGKTISVGQKGRTLSGCTCYPTWPNRMCLDETRASHEKEFAMLISAQARGEKVGININESTCEITSIYEQTAN